MNDSKKMENIVSLAKRRGFIYPGSDIYGGLSGTWDFGPLGVALKRNIMQLWWNMFVEERQDMYGIDAAILMNQKVWQASGHVDTFTDPLVTCMYCSSRFRVDKIIDQEEYTDFIDDVLSRFYDKQWNIYLEEKQKIDEDMPVISELKQQVDSDKLEFEKLKASDVKPEIYAHWSEDALSRMEQLKIKYKDRVKSYDYLIIYIKTLEIINQITQEARAYTGDYAREYLNANISCQVCNHREWALPQKFNMMFKTNVGPVADESSISYLRPETAQGIFTNYKNVVDTFYPDLPFGLAQQGKAFRNEISPRDFIFRSREFEQMEIEYFVDPSKWEEAFEHWREQVWKWTRALGLPDESVHELEVPENDRAHYSKRTIDFEFDFPIGREELLGLAYRTDFDLGNIQRVSGKNMDYTIKGTNTKFVPHVIEPSFGVERALMAVLSTSYRIDEVGGEAREYLALPEHLAPVKFAVSPLLKNKPELVAKAREVFDLVHKKYGAVMWDDNGNIGKRYRRQDEIGTPHCIVIDFTTLEDGTVTVRDRDTTEQKRLKIEAL